MGAIIFILLCVLVSFTYPGSDSDTCNQLGYEDIEQCLCQENYGDGFIYSGDNHKMCVNIPTGEEKIYIDKLKDNK